MAKKEEEHKEESSMLKKIGPWAFILGLVVAVIAAIVSPSNEVQGVVIWGLGLLGLLVGLINITEKEMNSYLLATIAFIVAANGLTTVFDPIPVLGAAIRPFTRNVIVFVAPGAAVVALKALYSISKD